MDTLGQRLRELREQRGLTVRQFAERIRKHRATYRGLKRGEIPSAELLCVIAGLYRIAPEGLLDLAKECYLARAERDVEAKNSSVLALYRREKK